MFLIVGCGIWSFCANLFFCAPIRKSWHPELEGTCLSKKGAWLSYSGANIFISTVLILLPIPTIIKLQLQRRAKIALIGIFSLGVWWVQADHAKQKTFYWQYSSDIILSCLRLSSLSDLATTIDISWVLQPVGIWTNLEATVAVICASLPALRPLIAKAFPGFFSTLSNQSYNLPSRDHGNSRADFPIAKCRASTNFFKLGSSGQQRNEKSDIESGVYGLREPDALGKVKTIRKNGILVETSRLVHIGPHAYTCDTKQEGTFSVGKFW